MSETSMNPSWARERVTLFIPKTHEAFDHHGKIVAQVHDAVLLVV